MKNPTKRTGMLPFLGASFTALLLGPIAQSTAGDRDGSGMPFAEAELFFELNDTDGDLGIHASIDGEPWKKLTITDPKDREILDIRARRRLRRQGLTQLFFESAEPSFDELDPEDFFRRFPEGNYEIEAETLEGGELESTAHLSHVMPAPPANVQISGVLAAENCDADLPVISPPVVIRWDPVTESHPEIGKPGPIEVVKYELFVGGLAVELLPTMTAFQVPPEIVQLGTEFKFEIIVTEATGNNTAVESCFIIE